MGIRRIGRHLLHHSWRLRRDFPPRVLTAIERAIKAGEATHYGQVRFVVEGALDGAPLFRNQPARERALEVFSQLRIWDTAHNNGVLIYLLLADRDVEIVADRGINAKIGASGWEQICREMEADFRAGNFEPGAIKGIEAVSRELAKHFPAHHGGPNELPDAPAVM
ncbi:MAG: TPM domain-containing protein [Bradyrhizobium sp.]